MSRRRNLILFFSFMSIGNLSKIPLYIKCYFEMPRTFFVIEAEGFKFGVLGLLVAVFQQLKRVISCRRPLSRDK